MSSSNCCFLTCIQISQEAGQVVWCSHLLKNFPQFIVIHTLKGFGIVNKAEIDVFLELSCFFHDPVDVGNLISGSSAFSKTSLNMWKFTVHVLLKPGLENYLSITLLACEMSAIVWQFEHSLALPFFGVGMKSKACWCTKCQRGACRGAGSLLARVSNGTAALERRLAASHRAKYELTRHPNNCTLGRLSQKNKNYADTNIQNCS